MDLLPPEVAAILPPLYATENGTEHDVIARVKFFTPWSSWIWYAVEFDGNDLFWGLVDGLEFELGYFSLAELKAIRGLVGFRIERDLYFKPTPIAELKTRRN